MEPGKARRRTAVGNMLAALIAVAAGLLPPAAASGQGAAREVDLLLVLASDVSDSMRAAEARLQRFGYVQAIRDPAVIAAIRKGRRGSIAVTYLEWASPDEQYQIIGWTRIAGERSARAFADALARATIEHGYWTSISAAIDRASALIAAAPFTAPRRVIDLSSDGRNNAGAPLAGARARAIARGITINGLVVLGRRGNFTWPPIPRLNEYFQTCVIGGPGAFTETAEGFRDFTRAVRRKLIREIAGGFPPAPRTRIVSVSARLAAADLSCE